MGPSEKLLTEWCDALRGLQIEGMGNPRLDGALMCPACGRIHGRCADAMYPFLVRARQTDDVEWIERAKALFEWTEVTVGQTNGAVLNDVDSSWDGITVFYMAMLADCLRHHSDLLDGVTQTRWGDRLARAAEYVYDYEALNRNNVNYSIGCAYALERASLLLGIDRYRTRGEELMEFSLTCLDESGMLFGEGVPRHAHSTRGRRPVDIGYNVEESLPIMALYAHERKDEALMARVRDALTWHLAFLLPDGGWDNSFGTRKFKWSYWGSRTTDGSCLGLLLAARDADAVTRDSFERAARANLGQLRACTVGGLLSGGPHYRDAGQQACIHHSFDHAKMLAGVIDLGLADALHSSETAPSSHVEACAEDFPVFVEQKVDGIDDYPNLGVSLVRSGSLRATVCTADWEYKRDVCTSGGMISLLHHRELGPVFAAGMGSYRRIELANMQVAHAVRHESLAPRIELADNGAVWSSVFDTFAIAEQEGSLAMRVAGSLRTADHEELADGSYEVRYVFDGGCVACDARFEAGSFVLPIISRARDRVTVERRAVTIERVDDMGAMVGSVVLSVEIGSCALPYGSERIFNLTPGFQALRVDIAPEGGCVSFRLCCTVK